MAGALWIAAAVCLAARVAAAAGANATEGVLTKEECKSAAPLDSFATDNRIISCVREASAQCCEAMDELLGEDSPVHFCTCSSGVLEEVLDQAVPMFAKEIIHTRIEECELPVAGEERCEGLYDDSDVAKAAAAEGGCADEYPPDVDTQYTCADQAGFGKCEEGWMQGFCLLSCGKCDSAAAPTTEEEEEEETETSEEALMAEDGEVLANGTMVLSNCTDVKSPSDTSDHDCPKQKDFGKCDEGWMQGYCELSCGKCVLPQKRKVASAASVPKDTNNGTTGIAASPPGAEVGDEIQKSQGGAMNSTEAGAGPKCPDEYPPNVDTQFTCADQASFGNCDDDWMQGFCLLSCGKCDGEEENATASGLSQ